MVASPNERVPSSLRHGIRLVPRNEVAGPTAIETNHLFVNNVRFWSMAAVLVLHGRPAFFLFRHASTNVDFAVNSIFKFGTIAFFLISGFLLGKRLDNCKPMTYLGRRLKTVFVPWLLWFTLTAALLLVCSSNPAGVWSSGNVLGALHKQIVSLAFSSAFWFVPNLLLGLATLLLFRKHIYDLRLGAFLLLTTLFYAGNIYRGWVPTSHTEAPFGFVFYLWLGAYTAFRFVDFQRWMKSIRTPVLLLLTILSGTAAFFEARLINSLHLADPLNSIRLTNQVFSILVVLLLYKLDRPTWPAWMDVRRYTFGLYLSHTLVVAIAMHFATRRVAPWMLRHTLLNGNVGAVALWLGLSAIAYAICTTLIRQLTQFPLLEWTVAAGPYPGFPKRLLPQTQVLDPDLSFSQTRP